MTKISSLLRLFGNSAHFHLYMDGYVPCHCYVFWSRNTV